jgi:3-oxoacyl-[acyl-carrier protein] reductase
VSGGSRGIGHAIAQALAAAEHRVVVLSRCADAADAAAASLCPVPTVPSGDSSHIGVQCDVSCTASIDEAVRLAVGWGGAPHVLVNAAGVSHDALLLKATDEQIDETIGTNLLGPLRLCRAVTKAMLRGRVRGGSIINVGSVVGSSGNTGQSVYAASKSGLGGLTRSLARELGPRDIRVNLVEPGFIDAGLGAAVAASDPERVAYYASRTALGRLGSAEEVARVVHFLAGPDAGYITGQTLRVDGGLSL